MDSENSESSIRQESFGKIYFAGLALFVVMSIGLSIWAVITLALEK